MATQVDFDIVPVNRVTYEAMLWCRNHFFRNRAAYVGRPFLGKQARLPDFGFALERTQRCFRDELLGHGLVIRRAKERLQVAA